MDYIKSRNINVNTVILKYKPEPKYKSFKITIFKKDLDNILSNDFCPEGVMCKIWRNYDNKKSKSLFCRNNIEILILVIFCFVLLVFIYTLL